MEADLFPLTPPPAAAKTIKAISLTQPWASLIAIGAKRIETRSWKTDYRGPLAIHASKGFPTECRVLCTVDPFLSALIKGLKDFRALWQNLPVGMVLATGRLVDCVRITRDNLPDYPERHFGNYEQGRWAWHIADVVILEKPVPAKGMLQLWDWTQPD